MTYFHQLFILYQENGAMLMNGNQSHGIKSPKKFQEPKYSQEKYSQEILSKVILEIATFWQHWPLLPKDQIEFLNYFC